MLLPFVLLIIMCVGCGQECGNIQIKATNNPENNFVSFNVSLFCNYSAPAADSVEWRWKSVPVYYAEPLDSSKSEPFDDHKGNVSGKFVEDGRHELILIHANDQHNQSQWQCIVTTPQCYDGKTSDPTTLILKEPVNNGVKLVGKDGIELNDKSKILVNDVIKCIATSDPKSAVELSGPNLKAIEDEDCVLTPGGLWQCSVSALYAGKGKIVCKSTFLDGTAHTVGCLANHCEGVFIPAQDMPSLGKSNSCAAYVLILCAAMAMIMDSLLG